ncbi:MAG: acyl carrier protein [Lautropia sp.]|nr:acyl carrier protein [Lautropia sp.]
MNTSQRDETISICLDVIEMAPEEIGLDDDFRSYSQIDSLKALDLMTALERHFGIKIPERDLREFESINKVVAVMERHLAAAA